MNLLKNLLVRLSDSFLSSVPLGFQTKRRKATSPVLKLVSQNPHPVVSPEQLPPRTGPSAIGHGEVLDDAIRRSRIWAGSRQNVQEGYWVFELEADVTLTSEYLMLRRFLGLVDVERERKAVRYLQRTQLADGGWPIYAGGPSEISASVKAYFAMKLAGVHPDEPCMQQARESILAKGGVTSANVFTKITLALFGQYDWRGIPSMPPEIILAPQSFYFNLYAVSYWTRAVVIPLLIVFSHRPICRISPEQGIDELYLVPKDQVDYRHEPPFHRDSQWVTWRNFFIWVDSILKIYEKYPLKSLRKRALKKAESWMFDHMQGDGGLGAIYPAMANSLFAMQALGYSNDHPLVLKALREIEALEIHSSTGEEGRGEGMLHLQPCHSPVWDTALMMNALIETGAPTDDPALTRAASWLRSCQVNRTGDWVVSSPQAKPGGWPFQFENEWYPDVDDTAVVIMALAKMERTVPADQEASIHQGASWALAMQSSDGGWGAYDKDNDRMIFNQIPFADHQALLDPSTADLTGRCLEMLGALGYDRSHPAVEPALEFLRREQEEDGSWYGRWGVNYIYGTWSVLAGLRAIGEDMSAPWVRRAVNWLELKQNVDGGWGESCLSYADPKEWSGRGDSTPSQTAWALLGLLSAGISDSLSVVRGINYLIRMQRADGSWEEPYHTGTGFPRVFYLRYHGYCQFFPLWALAMYRNVKAHGRSRADELRLTAQANRQIRLK